MLSSELLSGAQAKQDLPLAVTGGESAALLDYAITSAAATEGSAGR